MQLAACLLLGLAASAEDLWRRRISNVTVIGGLVAGLVIQVVLRGWLKGPLAWLAGASVGFAVFLVFFLAGGMGTGDIKLMAAFGACLGAAQTLRAALLAAMAGGLLACGYLIVLWMRRRWWYRMAKSETADRRSSTSNEKEAIPYAPAIFIGALLSFLA